MILRADHPGCEEQRRQIFRGAERKNDQGLARFAGADFVDRQNGSGGCQCGIFGLQGKSFIDVGGKIGEHLSGLCDRGFLAGQSEEIPRGIEIVGQKSVNRFLQDRSERIHIGGRRRNRR